MRLIDVDALFKEFEKTAWYDNADRDEIAEEILLQMPTIDAVEVVRCKDCKHKIEIEGISLCGELMHPARPVDVFGLSSYWFTKVKPDDFCSRGRRKDNG